MSAVPVRLPINWLAVIVPFTVALLFTARFPVTVVFELILTSLLNLTGPSNWERTVPELPPSTTSLSLIVTSSNTALNLDESSPVIVGIGLSNVTSSPVDEDVLRLPIKESPLLFIPV